MNLELAIGANENKRKKQTVHTSIAAKLTKQNEVGVFSSNSPQTERNGLFCALCTARRSDHLAGIFNLFPYGKTKYRPFVIIVRSQGTKNVVGCSFRIPS